MEQGTVWITLSNTLCPQTSFTSFPTITKASLPHPSRWFHLAVFNAKNYTSVHHLSLRLNGREVALLMGLLQVERFFRENILNFGIPQGVNYIAASFVQSGKDVRRFTFRAVQRTRKPIKLALKTSNRELTAIVGSRDARGNYSIGRTLTYDRHAKPPSKFVCRLCVWSRIEKYSVSKVLTSSNVKYSTK